MAIGNVGDDEGGSATLLRFIREGRSFSGREPHCFYLNLGNGRFADASFASHLNLKDDGRAVAVVDWDHDGDLDLWCTNRNGPQLRYLQNNLPAGGASLMLKLRGKNCNRDAIGARVEIEFDDGATHIQTLEAGSGYLAQSSKWIHVGIGPNRKMTKTTVKWPGGDVDEYRELQANKRYELTEGGRHTESPSMMQKLRGAPANQDSPEDTATIRSVSISELPVPKLSYQDLKGKTAQVFSTNNRLVLLNLWASWCQPCIAELSEFTSRFDDLQRAQIDIVALNVDLLDPDSESNRDAVHRIIEELRFPFPSGMATIELVDQLQLMNKMLLDIHLPLPVPYSILIDKNGKLLCTYKGPVSIDQLLDDAKLSSMDREARRQASVPFHGRWHEPPNRISHVPMLDALIKGGHLESADDYIRRLPEARKAQLLPAIVRLGIALYRDGRFAKAKEHLQVAVRIDPSFDGVELALGKQRELEQRPDSAIKLYREALRRNPKSIQAMNNLAWLLATHHSKEIRDGKEAVRLAEQAVRISGDSGATILDTLAVALAETGEFDRAVTIEKRALAIARERGHIALSKKLEHRIQMFEESRPFHQSSAPGRKK